mmetsp:Transcript_15321/g.47985  ORF Transcript_15321/g.47985 Transcript_15321/m.47985 type:complete len:1499 (-) Transcript_15321:247-4743(-)|eukprot:CAMPEP_0197397852 /NCGR_PEP_ID=MMETSP1165-20131217/12247_1 /TAXON_ID=284809 /ORGANISM="Chrysocystis fragilis, Strain CCMP3189" /LENGTH=1498 /DNA_ID=CAMNT_0042923773 /DNA_START=348 /DNA_END=4844 /DNA_ORIENTATION=-
MPALIPGCGTRPLRQCSRRHRLRAIARFNLVLGTAFCCLSLWLISFASDMPDNSAAEVREAHLRNFLHSETRMKPSRFSHQLTSDEAGLEVVTRIGKPEIHANGHLRIPARLNTTASLVALPRTVQDYGNSTQHESEHAQGATELSESTTAYPELPGSNDGRQTRAPGSGNVNTRSAIDYDRLREPSESNLSQGEASVVSTSKHVRNTSDLLHEAGMLGVPWFGHAELRSVANRSRARAVTSGPPRSADVPASFDVNMLRNAILFGDITGMVESKEDLYRRLQEAHGAWLKLLNDHVKNDVAMLWFGCFDGPHPPLTPLIFAAESPGSSIALIHACHGVANISSIFAIRAKLELQNVLVLSPRNAMHEDCDDDSEGPEAWRVGCNRDEPQHVSNSCAVLVISPGAIAALLDTSLPHTAEVALARVLQWCLKTLIIEDALSQNWHHHDYWDEPGKFVEAALDRIQQESPDKVTRVLQPILNFALNGKYGMHGTSRLLTVARNSSTRVNLPLKRQSSMNLMRLLSMFSLDARETIRMFTVACAKGCFLSCVTTSQSAEFFFAAGKLYGCNPDAIVARRKRFLSLFDGTDLLSRTRSSELRSQSMDRQGQSVRRVTGAPADRNAKSIHPTSMTTRLPLRGIRNAGMFEDTHVCSARDSTDELPLLERDECAALHHWWPHIKALTEGHHGPFTAFIVGDDLGLVALRLARKFKYSTVTVNRSRRLDALEKLAAVMGISNMVTTSNIYSSPQVHNGADVKPFSFVVLSSSVVVELLQDDCSPEAFRVLLGDILIQASHAALVELPRFSLLRNFMLTFGSSDCAERFSLLHDDEIKFVADALVSVSEVRRVSIGISLPASHRLTRLNKGSAASQMVSPAEDPLLLKLTFERERAPPKSSGSVPVSALLRAGLTPKWRTRVLRAHLALPLWCATESSAEEGIDALSATHLRLGPEAPAIFSAKNGRSLNAMTAHADGRGAAPPLVLHVPQLNAQLASNLRQPMNSTLWIALEAFISETPSEHRNGRFSFFEWGGRGQSVAVNVARKYPNATVVAILGDHPVSALNLQPGAHAHENMAICAGVPLDRKLAIHMFESPELARYSLLGLESLLTQGDQGSLHAVISAVLDDDVKFSRAKEMVGALILSSVTSFLPIPSAQHVCLAVWTLFGLNTGISAVSSSGQLRSMPELSFAIDTVQRLVSRPKLSGKTLLTVRSSAVINDGALVPPPLLRIDVMNMTKPVHHHFDWARDGHARTYTMHVVLNQSATSSGGRYAIGSSIREVPGMDDVTGGGIVELDTTHVSKNLDLAKGHHITSSAVINVFLLRDEDGSYIPYGSIRSVTLIAAIRMGLIHPQRRRAFSKFVNLPLYEDMAPWNIALKGPQLDYIDYDTHTETFDQHVSKVYRVLSLLMNYKRTVQDLGMCGPKAKTPYGFSLVSECVKPKDFQGVCVDTKYPVPCDDGHCHSDFISCLRSISFAGETAQHTEGSIKQAVQSLSNSVTVKYGIVA